MSPGTLLQRPLMRRYGTLGLVSVISHDFRVFFPFYQSLGNGYKTINNINVHGECQYEIPLSQLD